MSQLVGPRYADPTTLRASAVLTNAYVASLSLDIKRSNYAQFHVKLTKGSLTNAMIKFEISPDGSIWLPASLENNGAPTISGDESQTDVKHAVKVMAPSTAAATYYMFGLRDQVGKYMRAQILGTGTLTDSLAEIKAFAGVV